MLPTWAEFDAGILPEAVSNLDVRPSQYDFRNGPRDPDKQYAFAWADQDTTANYDPKAKEDPWLKPPTECILRRKRPASDRTFNYEEYRTKKPRTATWQRGRLDGKRKVVTLKFESDEAIGRLKLFGSSLNNWPDDTFRLPGGEPDWEAWWNSHEPVPASQYLYWDTYDLRDRGVLDGDDQNVHVPLKDVTLGHPAARGCKACFALGYPCPLLEEGSKYPCAICVEDDIECELILEPQEKTRCSTCTKKRVVCSFVTDPTMRGPCNYCNANGQRCVAGPKGGRTRTGPAYDAIDLASEPPLELGRAYVTCTECRKAKKWCSLKDKRAKPPCLHCHTAGIDCTFQSLSTSAVNRKVARRPKFKAHDVPKIKNNLKIIPSKSAVVTITTQLAHPIHFNHQPGQDESVDCHWCEDLVYGLLGLGEIQVRVIDSVDNQGLIEMSSGHTAAGHASSKMCDKCTLNRLMIAGCRTHQLEPIKGMHTGQYSITDVIDHMMPGLSASAPFEWCSLCVEPATFKCGTLTAIEDAQKPAGGNATRKGCGLALCEACAVGLVGEHKGNLEALIDALRTGHTGGGGDLRADVDLLHAEGELLRPVTIS